MSLQQVESFYWVARLGGFHAAARHQHLTQPTITARIQELEEILGAKLFERGAYRAVLTSLGRDVLAQAEKLLQLAADFEQSGTRRNPMFGLLRLGANESTAMGGLIELLARLKASYPDMHVELTVDVGAALSRKLNARELDIAILMDPISASHVIDEPIGRAELQWMASPQLGLPRRTLTPVDMASLPIVVTPPQTSLHDMVVDWFRNGNCSIDKLNVCNSVSFMVQLVAAGHAVALLPRSIVQAQVDAGMIRPLQVTPAISLRTYYVSYLREQPGLADGMLTRLAREVFMQSGLLQAR